MVILLVLLFVVIALIEVPTMVVHGQTGELRAFWVLLAIGFALSLALLKHWLIPGPFL